MSDIRAAAINFEAVKLALRQSKDGIALTLSVHPSDMPAALWSHPIGARYMVALVRLDDTDQPVSPPDDARVASISAPSSGLTAPRPAGVRGKPDTKQRWQDCPLSKRAAIMCGEPEFYDWIVKREAMMGNHRASIAAPAEAAEWLRHRTAVTSRKEYDTDPAAAQRYLRIERAYYGSKVDAERYG